MPSQLRARQSIGRPRCCSCKETNKLRSSLFSCSSLHSIDMAFHITVFVPFVLGCLVLNCDPWTKISSLMNFKFLRNIRSSSSKDSFKGKPSRIYPPSESTCTSSNNSPKSKPEKFFPSQNTRNFCEASSFSSPHLSFSRSGTPTSFASTVDRTSRHLNSRRKSKKFLPPCENPSDPRYHICSTCGKTFTKSEQMKRHYRLVHLQIRSYKCNGCDLAFGTKQSLEVHEKTRKHQDRRVPAWS